MTVWAIINELKKQNFKIQLIILKYANDYYFRGKIKGNRTNVDILQVLDVL